MFKPLLCVRRLRRAMAERLPDRRHRETHEGGPRGSERPAEPKNPPGASALGLMPCAKPGAAAPAGVVAPRYRSSRGEDLSSVRREDRHEGDDRGRSRSRHRAHRRRRDKALPAEDRREETPPKKKAKRSSAASAAAAPPPAKSSSSSSSEEEVQEEPAPKSSSMALATGSAPTAAVPAWLQSRVDGLTRKAAVFSRALTRAQQALRTAARIAREAAQSFECELEHLISSSHNARWRKNLASTRSLTQADEGLKSK